MERGRPRPNSLLFTLKERIRCISDRSRSTIIVHIREALGCRVTSRDKKKNPFQNLIKRTESASISEPSESGYAVVPPEDVKTIEPLLESFKLVLVPESFDLDSLSFKHYYKASKNEGRIKYNIETM